MDINEKINKAFNKAWALLYDIREERKAPYKEFNDDSIANLLLHAMNNIEEAYKEWLQEKNSYV